MRCTEELVTFYQYAGQYVASDLAQLDVLKRENIEPRKTVVEGVEWVEGSWEEVDGKKSWIKQSRLVFPDTFDGRIETDVGRSDVSDVHR